jgi:hypothetical protein
MSYIKFDRHANMTSETRREIMDILKEVDFNTGFDLMNMLYGLFDGYLYDDLLPVTQNADYCCFYLTSSIEIILIQH